jgi:hypothetical protein
VSSFFFDIIYQLYNHKQLLYYSTTGSVVGSSSGCSLKAQSGHEQDVISFKVLTSVSVFKRYAPMRKQQPKESSGVKSDDVNKGKPRTWLTQTTTTTTLSSYTFFTSSFFLLQLLLGYCKREPDQTMAKKKVVDESPADPTAWVFENEFANFVLMHSNEIVSFLSIAGLWKNLDMAINCQWFSCLMMGLVDLLTVRSFLLCVTFRNTCACWDTPTCTDARCLPRSVPVLLLDIDSST